ncbi:MAG: DUF3108 domain-containing protein [bacterium]
MKKLVLFLFIYSFALCEELFYNVKILGINAGTQRIITREEESGIMVISDTKTNKFFSKFYKLDDRIETLVDKETFLPVIIKEKIEEGKEKKELLTYLSQDRLEATIIEGDIRKEINLSKETFNIPSLINLLRNKELKVGSKEIFSIITLGKIEDIEVQVESLQNIYFEGERGAVFKVVAKDVVLWFSRENGVPLIIEVKLKCGLALKGYLKKG